MGYLFDPDNWEWLTTGNNARFVFEGFLVNVQIALVAMVFSLVVGLGLALLRLTRNRVLNTVVGIWIDVWRNLPLLLLILFIYLVMPQPWKESYEGFAPGVLSDQVQEGAVFAALTALVLYNSAILAEIMRAGIQSLDRGQNEAAMALGLTYWQRMRIIILPQGLRRMLPATVSQLITLNKDTTLISIIAIQEVMRHGRILTGQNFFGGVQAPILQVFLFIGVLFIVTNLALSRLSRRLELRERARTGTHVKPVSGLEDQVTVAQAR